MDVFPAFYSRSSKPVGPRTLDEGDVLERPKIYSEHELRKAAAPTPSLFVQKNTTQQCPQSQPQPTSRSLLSFLRYVCSGWMGPAVGRVSRLSRRDVAARRWPRLDWPSAQIISDTDCCPRPVAALQGVDARQAAVVQPFLDKALLLLSR